jgi:tetrapyrrole methylase family protein/MazG family protein
MPKRKKASFRELVKIMARLRAPGGCPWDRAQTHESLLKYLREETEEVCEAVQKKDHANLQEELGDVLLQVLFHANLARERGDFDIYDVLGTLKRKLVTRHPHVFGKGKKEELTPDEVKRRWNLIKEKERRRRN